MKPSNEKGQDRKQTLDVEVSPANYLRLNSTESEVFIDFGVRHPRFDEPKLIHSFALSVPKAQQLYLGLHQLFAEMEASKDSVPESTDGETSTQN